MNLTDIQRYILMNQFDILAKVSNDEYDEKRFKYASEVVYNGYTKLYSDIFPTLSREDDFQIVFDILNMYSDLLHSYNKLKETSIDRKKVIFKGLDGNEETKYYLFAQFLVEEADRYPEFKELPNGFNSHANMIPKYKRQLEIYQPFKEEYLHSSSFNPDGFLLTEEQIKNIIEA